MLILISKSRCKPPLSSPSIWIYGNGGKAACSCIKRTRDTGLVENAGWYVEIVDPSLERDESGMVYLEKSMRGNVADVDVDVAGDDAVLIGRRGIAVLDTGLEYGGGSDVNV